MSNHHIFGSYVEALQAVGTVESRHRDALRRAVEESAAAESRIRERIADQQRMYDRARSDANDVEQQLKQLSSALGQSRSATASAAVQGGAPPQLVAIRAQIREVGQWAAATQSTAESLFRTRERIANAPRPIEPVAAPTVVAQGQSLPVSLILAVALAVLVVVLVIIAQ